jgi:hypothetical protein
MGVTQATVRASTDSYFNSGDWIWLSGDFRDRPLLLVTHSFYVAYVFESPGA